MRQGAAAPGSAAKEAVPWADLGAQCVIDDDAVQKYVLIEVERSRLFVRGSESAAYHKDAARPFTAQCRKLGVAYDVLGGGRIEHSTSAKTIKVYGFSYGFPWRGAPLHEEAAKLLRRDYPSFTVTTSNEGY